MLGIVAQFAINRYRLSYFRMNKIPMVTFPTSIHKACRLQVANQLSNRSWHELLRSF